MSTHSHDQHEHVHGPDCGHTAEIEVTAANPGACTIGHECTEHGSDHIHGDTCGHEAVPHGDHMDYLVGGHLHHPHGGHCDNHGRVSA